MYCLACFRDKKLMCSDICFLRLPAFKEFFDLDKAVGRGGTIVTLQLFHAGWQENKKLYSSVKISLMLLSC